MTTEYQPTTKSLAAPALTGWGIVEINGHRTHAGEIKTREIFGSGIMRIFIPNTQGKPPEERYYPIRSIFSVTMTDEATARAKAKELEPRETIIEDEDGRWDNDDEDDDEEDEDDDDQDDDEEDDDEEEDDEEEDDEEEEDEDGRWDDDDEDEDEEDVTPNQEVIFDDPVRWASEKDTTQAQQDEERHKRDMGHPVKPEASQPSRQLINWWYPITLIIVLSGIGAETIRFILTWTTDQ